MKPLTFVQPGTLGEVIQEVSQHVHCRLIAGGTDLLDQLKEGSAQHGCVVSLGAVDELRGIQATAEGLRIGALTTISDIELSPELTGPYRILAEAARSVATPEVRNQGTLGGNLCQRPRCLHYRHPLAGCLKKGADGCPATESPYQAYLSVFGGPGCHAVNPSDLAPPLIALDARASIEGPFCSREMPLASFFVGPDTDPERETALVAGEVLTSVLIPARPPGWRGAYFKARERTAGDFAIASLALGYELQDGRMRDVRAVLGGVAPRPLRSHAAEEALEGNEPTEAAGAAAADAALAGAKPLSHNAFKLDLARALITRGVARLAAT